MVCVISLRLLLLVANRNFDWICLNGRRFRGLTLNCDLNSSVKKAQQTEDVKRLKSVEHTDTGEFSLQMSWWSDGRAGDDL